MTISGIVLILAAIINGILTISEVTTRETFTNGMMVLYVLLGACFIYFTFLI